MTSTDARSAGATATVPSSETLSSICSGVPTQVAAVSRTLVFRSVADLATAPGESGAELGVGGGGSRPTR
jgi:hypothetical protein